MLPVFGLLFTSSFGRRIRKSIFNLRAQETVGLQELVEQQQRDLAYTKEKKIGPAEIRFKNPYQEELASFSLKPMMRLLPRIMM